MTARLITASDVMTTPVFVVSPTDTIGYARNLMIKHHISRVLVMDAGNLAGILTKKDLGYRLRQESAAWRRRPLDQSPVMEIATRNPAVVAPDVQLKAVAGIFVTKNISSVPVVEHGAVMGIVTKTDLMKSDLVADLPGTVRDVMEDAVTVNPWHSLAHVVATMSGRAEKAVVTGNDGSVAGIITETDLALHETDRKRSGVTGNEVPIIQRENGCGRGVSHSTGTAGVTAGDIMKSPVITVTPSCPLREAIALMRREQVNSLVVLERGTLVGIVKRDDIIKEVTK